MVYKERYSMIISKLLKETLTKLAFEKPTTAENRTNPISGITHTLVPEACQLYDFITTSHYVCGKDYTRKAWDNARYYFCQEWPDEYFDLLD